jgi:NADPH:quinone reductase-like Zn-dependent oxidoreductase
MRGFKTGSRGTSSDRWMKAILGESYGPPDKVLKLREVEKPVPGEGQALLKVHAASVNISDYYGITGFSRLFGGGLLRPKDPRVGGDVAGTVETVGPGISRFKPGDEVFGVGLGSFAEFTLAREARLALKPGNVSFEEAAAVPVAGLTALQCLRDKGRVQAGQDVAVNGASGGVGTFAVQVGKSLGAQVTGVCSTRNMDQARSIGADHVVDYSKEDFTRSGRSYDLICDIVGNRSVSDYRRALKTGGVCLIVGFSGNPLLGLAKFAVLGPLGSLTGNKRIKLMGIAKMNAEDLGYMAGLLASNKVKPTIEKRYGLGEAAQALEYIGEKHTRGKVVIAVS